MTCLVIVAAFAFFLDFNACEYFTRGQKQVLQDSWVMKFVEICYSSIVQQCRDVVGDSVHCFTDDIS